MSATALLPISDPFAAWLQSADGVSTKDLIARDTSGLALRAARLAFYYGRMDVVALGHGKPGYQWDSHMVQP